MIDWNQPEPLCRFLQQHFASWHPFSKHSVRLLPYDTFTLQTPDSLAIVLARMATQIEPPKAMRWHISRNHLPYEGTLSETGFHISRIIHYRNSFLPIIRGRFEPSPAGTAVQITMRLHPVVIAFLVFWYLV